MDTLLALTESQSAVIVNAVGIVVCATITYLGYRASKDNADQALKVATDANDLSDKANRIADDALSYVKKKDEVDVQPIEARVAGAWPYDSKHLHATLTGFQCAAKVYCGGKEVFIDWVGFAKDTELILECPLHGPERLEHGQGGEYHGFFYAHADGAKKLADANRLFVRTAGGLTRSIAVIPWNQRAEEERKVAEDCWAEMRDRVKKNPINFG